jgi:hypothetical protein
VALEAASGIKPKSEYAITESLRKKREHRGRFDRMLAVDAAALNSAPPNQQATTDSAAGAPRL